MSVEVAIIAALSANGVIGIGTKLPWCIRSDMDRFRTLTSGHSVVMGRRTFEGLPNALSNRQSIVVSNTLSLGSKNLLSATSLGHALALCDRPAPIFVIGGSQLYAEALSIASTMYLTQVHRDFDGDTFMPHIDYSKWKCVKKESFGQTEPEVLRFSFVDYVRA